MTLGSLAATWRVLLRHCQWRPLLRDALVLTAAGLLASFTVLYVGRLSFDTVRFGLGLDYHSSAPGQHPGGLTIASSDLGVISVRDSQRVHQREQTSLTVWTYAPGDAPRVGHLIAGVVLDGEFSGRGVALDEASAHTLGARVGDPIVLNCDLETPPPPVTVEAIIAPFHEPEDAGNGGLVVVAEPELASRCPADPTSSTTYFDSPTSAPGATTKIRAVIRDATKHGVTSPLVIGVAVIGFGLWALVLRRITQSTCAMLRPHLDLLVALGQSPRPGNGLVRLLIGAMTVFASAVGGVVARQLCRAWTGFYLTAPQVLLVVAVLTLLAWPITSLALKRKG